MRDMDMALEILPATHDGDELSPGDLYILECAVNGFLTDAGKEYFREMHRKVMAGEYVKPWLAGVEHLTIKHSGYVYWKGREVEHFTTSIMTQEDIKEQSEELARRCRIMEEHAGLDAVSCHTVIWLWPKEGEEAKIRFAKLTAGAHQAA